MNEVVTNPVSPCVPRESATESGKSTERVNLLLDRGTLDFLDCLARDSRGKLNRSLVVRGVVLALADRQIRMPGVTSEEGVRRMVSRLLGVDSRPVTNTPSSRVSMARPLAPRQPQNTVMRAAEVMKASPPLKPAADNDECTQAQEIWQEYLAEHHLPANPNLPQSVNGRLR